MPGFSKRTQVAAIANTPCTNYINIHFPFYSVFGPSQTDLYISSLIFLKSLIALYRVKKQFLSNSILQKEFNHPKIILKCCFLKKLFSTIQYN